MSPHSSDTLREAMRDPAFYPHPTVHNIQVIHTHISTVFLTGEFAYKIKKPVNFGFLDFTQLADRKHFCHEELHLNRRLAPALYLDVAPILYKDGCYQLGTSNTAASGDIVEYAVKMRQFDPQQTLDLLLAAGSLPVDDMDILARHITRFHQNIETAAENSRFDLPAKVLEPMQQNFVLLRTHLHDIAILKRLSLLESWTQQEYSRVQGRLLQRKHEGHIRACHGDMHLGNIAVVDGEITIFDGIEFNEDLRWIDTASEIAFLLMDLAYRHAPTHAHRLLNRYLETGGLDNGIYSAEMSTRTYDRLAELSRLALQNHFSVVVDATFLDAGQRLRFRQLAQEQNAAFIILHFSGTPAQLEANILRRQQANTDASDADIAVLHKQLEQYKPLQDDEPCVTVPPNECLPISTLEAHLSRLGVKNAS